MASKSRKGDEFEIRFKHVEMLKIEKLLTKISELDKNDGWLSSEENEWLSNALDLFAPELPSGGYEI